MALAADLLVIFATSPLSLDLLSSQSLVAIVGHRAFLCAIRQSPGSTHTAGSFFVRPKISISKMATKEDQEILRLLVQYVSRAFYEPKYTIIMDQLARHAV